MVDQTVEAGHSLSYDLPPFKDLEHDTCLIFMISGPASVFARVLGQHTLSFNPGPTFTGSYPIVVVVEDQNKFPKSNQYKFTLTVTPNANSNNSYNLTIYERFKNDIQ